MRIHCLLVLILAGCGPSQRPLSALSNRQLGAAVTLPAPSRVTANLGFDAQRGACPAVSVAADIDGSPLAPSFVDAVGETCIVGFSSTADLPSPAPLSTVRFTDGTTVASLTALRLFERNRFRATLADGSIVHAADVVELRTAIDGDAFVPRSASVTFVNGSLSRDVIADDLDDGVRIVVPPLSAGIWTLHMSAQTMASVASCSNATDCGSPLITSELSVPLQFAE